jgi:AraC family transcriptional regulator, positive regulator of tynA and feaB
LTLIDASQPMFLRFSRDNMQLALHLPRALMDERRRYRPLPLAATFSGGAASITAGFLKAAFENAADCQIAQSDGIRDALLSLIFSNIMGNAQVDQAVQAGVRQLLPVLQAYVMAHLSDPTLSPAGIAQAHGISVRQLHRLFAPTGTTLGNWIRLQRLQCCADDLRNSELQIVKLTDIAHQWGFSDSAHFSRAFKDEFGQTPSHYRMQYSRGYEARPRTARMCAATQERALLLSRCPVNAAVRST